MSLFKGIKKAIKGIVSPILDNPILREAFPGIGALGSVSDSIARASDIFGAKQPRMAGPEINRQVLQGRVVAPNLAGVNPMSLLTAGRALATLGTRATSAVARSGSVRGAAVSAAAGAGGAFLFDQFGNPVRRPRRRSKGITGTELKSFRRVTSILNKLCKSPPPTKRRSTRSTKCR